MMLQKSMQQEEQAISDRLEVARQAAALAGEVSLQYFTDPTLAVENKRDGSVVTIADRTAEQRVRAMIQAAFPDDGILGEEFGEQAGVSGWRWILDPIDGTKSFVHGVPLYGTLVAVEDLQNGIMQIGVIHMPALGETVWAARQHGCWHEPPASEARPARVSQIDQLHDAMVLSTALDYFSEHHKEVWLEIARSAGATRGWSDCYAHVLVATGRADVAVEPELHPWDIAAMLPIMAEAGGCCTDWQGRETAFSPHAICSNGLLHQQIRSMLSR